MVILVPPDDGIEYPSLGGQVVEWMHEHLVFGPGDLRGQPLQLDEEQQAFIWRLYELFPKGHPRAGRRRFRRGALSLAKGLRKTELGALIAAAELHPAAPVRFDGWQGRGREPGPGRSVTDPFVVLVAYTEEQSDELAYGALRAILEESPVAADFDIGLDRILRKGGDGKAVSVAGSPNARDGARTTFQLFDETHRMDSDRLRRAHQTMQANLPKRKIADAWGLEITTAYEPGAGSIAESTMEYARAVADGRIADSTLFFYHRQASDEHDLTTKDGARAAVIEASGAAAAWRDIDAIVALWEDPTTDRSFWERVWGNRIVKASAQAFDLPRWKTLARDDYRPASGALITLGFDGAQTDDSTGLVATEVATGYQWVAGFWERPMGTAGDRWSVPTEDVDARVRQVFDEYTVWRLYADPWFWQSWIKAWVGAFGKERVLEWWTNRPLEMSRALEAFECAIREGLVSHSGDPHLTRHLGNARKRSIHQRDDQGRPRWVIQKDRPDSPLKIDLSMAAVLSWEARLTAIAANALQASTRKTIVPSVFAINAGGVVDLSVPAIS